MTLIASRGFSSRFASRFAKVVSAIQGDAGLAHKLTVWQSKPMNPKSFFGELKRRNVYKVAVAYAVAGWALAQGIAQVFPVFDIPNGAVRLIVLAIVIGFPIALVIAWAFELTPEGIKRTEDVDLSAVGVSKNRAWIYVVLIGAAFSVGLFFIGRYTARNSSTASPSELPAKSIAVLPFENLSEEKTNAFFADGVQDEILTDLSKIADLKVISRTSVMHYKSGSARNLHEIGEQLGVAHVLEGSVQRAGNRVRVNAQLVDARTDRHLWAQTYDRDLADVFAIQSEIAKAIADQLQAKLSPREKAAIERPPTDDITAFDLYTRAKDVMVTAIASNTGKADFLQAIDLLNQAVARDPSFFQAYCRLAEAHDSLYNVYDHTSARLALAEAAIEAASRLRPNAGETHLARARNIYQGYLNYDGALVDLDWKGDTRPLHQMIDAIRATNPAEVQSIADRWLTCALAERDAADANNALSASGENPIALGSENVVFGRPFVEGVIARVTKDDAKAQSAFTAARAEQEKIVQAQPNYGPALCVFGLIDAGLGRKEEALREGRRAVELLPMEKDAAEGVTMVKDLAMIAAWIGDKDLACEQLAIAIRPPSNLSYGQLKLMPFWDLLRGDPRFEQIVASLAPKTGPKQ